MTGTDVTVLVPVYDAAAVVGQTLDSILAQNVPGLRVIVSVDAGHDDSVAACRTHAGADPRVTLVVQPARLGWVGNVNALIARVETPYFCIAPHDDLLEPGYLSAALAEMCAHPEAACVYGDLRTFGRRRLQLTQPPVLGSRLDRLVTVLLDHHAAIAFRGLVRLGDPARPPLLPTGLRGDFAADTVWMVELAARGELRRVPVIGCAKRLWPRRAGVSSVHQSWSRQPRDEVVARWVDHCIACARIALAHAGDAGARARIVTAAYCRLIGAGRAREDGLRLRGRRERAVATAAFEVAFPGDDVSAAARRRTLAHADAGALRAALAGAAPIPRLVAALAYWTRRIAAGLSW
jgi:hypothetical protein